MEEKETEEQMEEEEATEERRSDSLHGVPGISLVAASSAPDSSANISHIDEIRESHGKVIIMPLKLRNDMEGNRRRCIGQTLDFLRIPGRPEKQEPSLPISFLGPSGLDVMDNRIQSYDDCSRHGNRCGNSTRVDHINDCIERRAKETIAPPDGDTAA